MRANWTDEKLDGFKLRGDHLADEVVAKLVDGWDACADSARNDANLKSIQQAFGVLRPLALNGEIPAYLARHAASAGLDAEMARLVDACDTLPAWADLKKIERAEQLFRDSGVVSCILFFCACLPEVYAVPDISIVLHATGNLEKMTDQRIRATSAMILSVLLPGGVRRSMGAGRPKVLKARFIHAIMRHLFLRGNAAELAAAGPIAVPALPTAGADNIFRRAYAHGWQSAHEGVPCNQEELSYTLLTFGYVFLRGLRRLGLGFAKADEEAYLHLWNVVGHLLGIEPDMMAHTMIDAAELFSLLQKRALARGFENDPRPLLGEALVASIEKSISHRLLKPVAALVIEYLSSEATAQGLGLRQRFSFSAQCLFGAAMGAIKSFDWLVRRLLPNFSLARFILRVAGYQLVHAVLTDTTNPIDLPEAARKQINAMLGEWSSDQHAPRWMNQVEDYFTTKGNWRESIGV